MKQASVFLSFFLSRVRVFILSRTSVFFLSHVFVFCPVCVFLVPLPHNTQTHTTQNGLAKKCHWPKMDWPKLAWPKSVMTLTAETFLANPILAKISVFSVVSQSVRPRRMGAPKGGGQNPEKVGPRRVGGPKFRVFFSLLPTISLFLSLSGSLLVEFWCKRAHLRDPAFGITTKI